MMMKSVRSFYFLALLFTATLPLQAQTIQATSAQDRDEAIQHRKQMRAHSIFKDYPVRSVGPVVMSGRVTDIAVENDHPSHFYVAYASGGVFETTNSGQTMQPIFDHQGTLTIGDIAISRAADSVLWVGTGENNSSRSTYAGNGIYRSTDGGKNWKHAGLKGSQHIGRIVTHPDDPNIAWVASSGPLYSMNDVRGVYKTTDGGKHWNLTLTPPDSTGVIDLVIDPGNPDHLLASTWQRFRQAWNFQEAGAGSAIFESTDGGESWHKSMQGFPDGASVGRIGLAISRSNPDVVYAYLDNQKEKKTKKEATKEKNELTARDLRNMSKKEFQKLDNDRLNHFLTNHGFPEKYNAQGVKNEIEKDVYKPEALANYLGDANSDLFNTRIAGAQVYRSNDGGQSWSEVNKYKLDDVIYTYGYYFGQVRVSPTDSDVVYILGLPSLKSSDGGRTWKPIAENQPVHVDHHAMWIDPNKPQHLLLGNDGGLYESYDGGANFIHHNNVAVAQFYSVAVDMEKPYNIYGGMQDNGVFSGSSQGKPHDQNYWERIFGGDGMHVAVDPRNSDRIYTGFQFGNYFRINQGTHETKRITPKADIGKEKLRFNWNTPIEMSNHNPDIIYMGSQFVHRSFDRGDHWQIISPDLTSQKKSQQQGDVPYSTITTISESPKDFNVIWAGTDDGNIQVTRDGGKSWQLVSKKLQQDRWISQVHASSHDAGTAYVSLNGYRYDEFKTYIYKTTDYGQHWTSIKGNLPESVANVIIQDPENSDILYAGLDAGTFVSMNDGKQWFLLNGVPNVPSYDMLVHPRDMDLVVGTHGRSVYVADVEPLHRIAGHMNEPILALKPEAVQRSSSWGDQPVKYRPKSEPKTQWIYWVGDQNADQEKVNIRVKNEDGKTVAKLTDKGSYGFNVLSWNLQIDDKSAYLGAGKYTIIYNLNGHTDETTFTVTGHHDDGRRVFPTPEEIEHGEIE